MFDWRAFLQVAEELAKNNEHEGSLRTAVSRAYYAAYHVTKNYVEQVRPGSGIGSSHERVWNALRSSAPGMRPTEGRVRADGFKLRDHRVNADYIAQAASFDRTVVEAMRLARRIISDVEALLKVLNRP